MWPKKTGVRSSPSNSPGRYQIRLWGEIKKKGLTALGEGTSHLLERGEIWPPRKRGNQDKRGRVHRGCRVKESGSLVLCFPDTVTEGGRE